MFKTILTLCAIAATPALADPWEWGDRNTDFAPAFPEQTRAPLTDSGIKPAVTTIASGLENPWGVDVLPDGSGYLVTERTGALWKIGPDGSKTQIDGVPAVKAERQGGLLDITLAPDFAQSGVVCLSYAKPIGIDGSATAAACGTYDIAENRIDDLRDVFVQTPAVSQHMHFGSRVVFEDNDTIFVTTGERFSLTNRRKAQDLDSTFGKTVRVKIDGTVPVRNPFTSTSGARPEIYSLGHRNIQGAMIRDGVLWTIEHGPAGGDELNRIDAGKNYGWPVISYGENYNGSSVGSGKAAADGLEQPVYFWDPVIAPAGMLTYTGSAFGAWKNDVLIGSLNPGGVVRLSIDGNRVTEEERLVTGIGRVRDLVQDQDGTILALIDANPDGKLVRLSLK